MVTNNKKTKINPQSFFSAHSKIRLVDLLKDLMHRALTCSNKTESLNFSRDLDFRSTKTRAGCPWLGCRGLSWAGGSISALPQGHAGAGSKVKCDTECKTCHSLKFTA